MAEALPGVAGLAAGPERAGRQGGGEEGGPPLGGVGAPQQAVLATAVVTRGAVGRPRGVAAAQEELPGQVARPAEAALRADPAGRAGRQNPGSPAPPPGGAGPAGHRWG